VTTTAAWPTFETALTGRELVAERTMAFRFAEPADWSYRAGQFVDITLLDPPETDDEGNTRGFSISSAPSEGVIMITTRLRDTAFKRVLRTMPLGTRVRIEGPF
jgi:ferredoxin-NADP reductase